MKNLDEYIGSPVVAKVTEFSKLSYQLDDEEFEQYRVWVILQDLQGGWTIERAIHKVEEILGNRLEKEIFGE